ncbi:MAG: hypothetical protein ABW168_21150, partial [Sedimenticola sp.]
MTTVAQDVTEKYADDNIFIPSNIEHGLFTQYAIDNLDFSECTLDGTSKHVTSMVMYQHEQSDNTLHTGSMTTVPKRVDRRTSLNVPAESIHSAAAIRKLRRNVHSENTLDAEFLLQQDAEHSTDMNTCWAIARLCPTKLLEVEIDCPGWKVFNAYISQGNKASTAIGYCPFLQEAPTNPDVVNEALQLCIKSSAKLGLKHTVVTQDQAIYEISYTMRKESPEKYDNLILRLGGFHLLMNYLRAVGKLMTGTGLAEILVSSRIMLEGTANKILAGKGYYQGINAHMRLHEAMYFLWWNAFEEYCINEEVDMSPFSKLSEKIGQLGDVLNVDTIQSLEKVSQLTECVTELKQLTIRFNDSRSEYKTHQLWLTYIGMIQSVLQFIHAEREGVWGEHLVAVVDMAKVIAA